MLSACGREAKKNSIPKDPEETPTSAIAAPEETPTATKSPLEISSEDTVKAPQNHPVTTTTLDATSKDPQVWTYFDLDAGKFMTGSHSMDDALWDLKFQRSKIATNGGVSGPGTVIGQIYQGDFDRLHEAPSMEYISDREDGPDQDTDPDTIFSLDQGWFDYNPSTHKLTPKPRSWVIRSSSQRYFKVKIITYYNDAGSPALFTIAYGEIQAPAKGIKP
jgi:hypothetical protein